MKKVTIGLLFWMSFSCVRAEYTQTAAADTAKPLKATPPDSSADASALRTWTSLQGDSLAATFVRREGQRVVLAREDGTLVRIGLTQLTAADQDAIRELETRLAGKSDPKDSSTKPAKDGTDESQKTTIPAKPGLLPVFTASHLKGVHAVYSNATFIAKVMANGQMTITCLDDGKPVGQPIDLTITYGYDDSGRQGRANKWRRIVSFDKAPEPTTSPTELEYEGTLDDEVQFGFGYEFAGNTVQTWAWVEDPKNIKGATDMEFCFRFRASHSFEPDVMVTEQKKILAPYSLLVEPVSGKPLRFPYGEPLRDIKPPPARTVSIDGPVFGARSVSVSAASIKEGALLPWINKGYGPYVGFRVLLEKKDAASRNKKYRMILTVK